MFSLAHFLGFCWILHACGDEALRGRTRQLQDSWRGTVVPKCRPGYIDVTAGAAYEWACAHYCVVLHDSHQQSKTLKLMPWRDPT
eukprot:s1571_g13.t1